MPTDDGAFVVGEPQGSPAWYPVNDNPRDKATFDFSRHRARRAHGDGQRGPRLAARRRRADDLGLARDRSDGAVPGDGDARPVRPHRIATSDGCPGLRRGRPAAPVQGQVLGQAAGHRRLLQLDLRAVSVQCGRRDRRHARRSSATRWRRRRSRCSTGCRTRRRSPTSCRTCGSATPSRSPTWPDIWLHEGFATWSEWIWSEHEGDKSAHQFFEHSTTRRRRTPRSGRRRPGNPGTPVLLFDGTIYDRGAMTLAGATGEGRRLHLLPDHAALGRAESLRQRDDGRSSSRSPSS